ncbi:MAG: PaaI family thioesterase [Roseiarcus sp.]
MLTTAPRVYGVTDPAEAMRMSGREFLEAIIDGRLPAPPMARTLSFWLVEIGDGFAVFEGDAGEHLLNPLGVVHGGWALTLIDSATGCAGQTVLPAGASYTTVETKANFSRAITRDTGRVRAEGRVVGRGRRIISCEGRIVDAGGRLLAHGTSTLMVLAGEKPTIAS